MNTTRVITRIEELDKKRSKIYINHEFAFVLYKGELRQYKLETEGVVEDDIYHEITQRVLPKRAKKRCLNLLQKRPYTEFKLREKLKEGYYSQEIIEDAIDYVKSFRYLDDYDYACQYIFYHKEVESRKKMEEKLAIKGISKEVLNKAFGDSYEDEDEQQELELKQARELLGKKKYDAEAVDWKEKQKIYAFLIRKGISVSIIKKAMSLQEDAI
ncbi:MAG: RecX family transcriptional regulator [Lachnospiraceae bacterium]|nr:RecX family transcriptional regulator [Lachnospiraceae bacterium]